MNDVKRAGARSDEHSEEEPSRGPSLTLIYSLIVLAMLAAAVIAAFIVLPFYHHR